MEGHDQPSSLQLAFISSCSARLCSVWRDLVDGAEDGKVTASWEERETPVPFWVTAVHVVFLAWTVLTAHFPVLFVGGFLFFWPSSSPPATTRTKSRCAAPSSSASSSRALVIHGGCQAWWIAPVIMAMSDQTLMLGATILTAFNDNAAITYLAAQVEGISMTAKYAVVAGAVTGGGLTVIANAPNPAGQSILSRFFKDGISPLGLFLGALVPTIIAYLCFMLLPSGHDGEEEAFKTPRAAIEQHPTKH